MRVLLKAGAVGPGLLAGTAIVTLLVGPALPVWAQLVVFFGGLLVLALLALGVGESWAVRCLFGARRLTELERAGLAPVLTELCGCGLGPPVARFYVARRLGAAAAVAHGRRSVVVSREVVHGVLVGQLPRDEAVAVLAHAVLVARAGLARQDPAIAFWSMPWRPLAALGRPLPGVLGFAWRIRAVVFGVAVWQTVTAGPPGAGSTRHDGLPGPGAAAALTLILAMTYLAPRFANSWDKHLTATGDQLLVARGLGPPMAAFLRRCPQTPAIIARSQLLDPDLTPRQTLRGLLPTPSRRSGPAGMGRIG
jgi:hypothetical protein